MGKLPHLFINILISFKNLLYHQSTRKFICIGKSSRQQSRNVKIWAWNSFSNTKKISLACIYKGHNRLCDNTASSFTTWVFIWLLIFAFAEHGSLVKNGLWWNLSKDLMVYIEQCFPNFFLFTAPFLC